MPALEIRRLGPEWADPLDAFFQALTEAGDDRFFHPHPLTAHEAHRLGNHTGQDLYYVVTEARDVLAYGFLRGWDDGFEVPSLGIAIRPDLRGMGLARSFMTFLHAAAARRGTARIRLKVYPGNEVALRLYRDLGYRFETGEDGQLVGHVDL